MGRGSEPPFPPASGLRSIVSSITGLGVRGGACTVSLLHYESLYTDIYRAYITNDEAIGYTVITEHT